MRALGKVSIKDNVIRIECMPHVAIKLARLFTGMKRQGAGDFTMKATPEVAYDLAWFSQRYQLDVEPAALDQFEKLRATHARKLEAISEVLTLGDDYRPPTFELALPPREYQRVAADLAIKSGSLVIGDDLGLGKTVSAICVLVAEGSLPALVVTLTHLRRQWVAMLKRFAPGLRAMAISKMQPYDLTEIQVTKGPNGRRQIVRGPSMPDVLIMGYHQLQGWCDTLAGRVRTVVYDEVQELRHHDTKRYEAAKAISAGCDRRVGLSATPIYNYGSEIHSVVGAVSPDALGDRAEFLKEWCVGGYGDDKKARVSDPAALGTYLRESGIMIRRTRKDVGRELPALTIARHEVESDEGSLQDVAADIAELARRVLARAGDRTERMRVAGELDWRLRQATGIAKAQSVVDFVRLLVENGEPVLLYGWHHEVYAIWENSLRRHGIEVARYTGRETDKEKAEARDAFIAGRAKVLIMSLRAGAGLDGLQAVCRTVVFGELDWSPMVHAQCIGRAHRDGQTEPVVAYYLVAPDGSDPVVADVLGIKEQQSEGIRNPEALQNAEPIAQAADENHMQKLAEAFLRRRAAA